MDVVIRAVGAEIKVWIDGRLVVDVVDPTPKLFGGIGVGNIWETHARYDDIVVIDEAGAPCPADLNGDGHVGLCDVVNLLYAWGKCTGCPEDLNGNGYVGTCDLLTLIREWGPCP